MLHGYTSSKAFNERGVIWLRDARNQQLCSLCDIHLPPHKGRVHWLDDWKVDFSTLPGSAPHHTPAVSTSRGEEWDWECGGKESPSHSPRGSPRRGYSIDSSLSSPDLVITLTQSQNLTTTVSSTTFTITSTTFAPPPPSPSNGNFKEGVAYSGTGEGFAYSTPPSCDKKGWLYVSRSSSCSSQGQRPRSASGVRHRRWVRSCAVRTEAPWQEVGPLRLKCLNLSRASPTSHCVDVWAVTDSGELVFRRDVTPSNPGGSSWLHYPTKWRLQFVAAAPESGGRRLWTICADFGLLWRLEQLETSVRWCCLGFAPSGAAWRLLAPVSPCCLWALDVDGALWVHLVSSCGSAEVATEEEAENTEGREMANWIKVASPRVSDISCSPDGKVWAVFSATNTLAVRTGISPKSPSGTGWLLAFEGIVSSVCIKGASVLV